MAEDAVVKYENGKRITLPNGNDVAVFEANSKEPKRGYLLAFKNSATERETFVQISKDAAAALLILLDERNELRIPVIKAEA